VSTYTVERYVLFVCRNYLPCTKNFV